LEQVISLKNVNIYCISVHRHGYFFLLLASAKHPRKVLVPGILVIVLLACGILNLRIITDPVELWAAPESRSRIEKDYFDKNFEPFYRTEQIIITAKNLPNVYHNTSDGLTSFGPIFNKNFMYAILDLQERIEAIVGEEGESLQDVCFKPLEPKNNNCTIFSIWGYWQNQRELLNKTAGNGDNYLDHFKFCTKNPAAPKDSTQLHLSCLGEYGGPIFPSVVVGGFLKDYSAGNLDPPYHDANTAIITFVVENHFDKKEIKNALEWEKAFVSFMKNYTKNEMPEFMEIAFNSERSIEDELARESEGEVSTIVISYLIMFAYISVSLGEVASFKRLFVRS